MNRRGLTLVEVLFAVALLATLALTTASIAVDVRKAREADVDPPSIDLAAVQIDALPAASIDQLREWEIGRSEPVGVGLIISRLPCPDCPDRFGRFEIEVLDGRTDRADSLILTRFYTVDPAAPSDTENPR